MIETTMKMRQKAAKSSRVKGIIMIAHCIDDCRILRIRSKIKNRVTLEAKIIYHRL